MLIPSAVQASKPAGPDKSIQFDNAGAFGALDAFKGSDNLINQVTVGSPVQTTGSGLSDITVSGQSTGTQTGHTYVITISATGTPDHFTVTKDGGSPGAPIAMTGSAQSIGDGISVTFAATTGHVVADAWTITTSPQAVIIPNGDNCVILDYWNEMGSILVFGDNTNGYALASWSIQNLMGVFPQGNNLPQWEFDSGTLNFWVDANNSLRLSPTSVHFYSGSVLTVVLDSSGVTSSAGGIFATAALATNATDGFIGVPTCPGTPTGTPTAHTGTTPQVVDSTNDLFYYWKPTASAWSPLVPQASTLLITCKNVKAAASTLAVSSNAVTPNADGAPTQICTTSLSAGTTINATSGTPVDGQVLTIGFDIPNSKTLTWDSSYNLNSLTPPAAAAFREVFQYWTLDSKWHATGIVL